MNSNKKVVNFPRGRSADMNTKNKRTKRSAHSGDDQLFSVRKRSNRDIESNVRSKRLKAKKNKNLKRDVDEDYEKIIIESMSMSKLAEGINIYGCIQQISDFDLKLSICGGIVATVPITNISNSYTHLLETFAQNHELFISSEMEVLKPNGMFKTGQYFPIKILSKINKDKELSGIDVMASLNPRDVYSDCMSCYLLKIPKLPIVAAVESIEDHGYVMDIGFDDVKAFLSKDKAQNAIQLFKGRKCLSVGQLVLCAIDSVINERSITLTTKSKILSNFKLSPDIDVNISCLIPGMKVQSTIMNINERGLELNILNDFSGFVNRNHLKNDWDLPKNCYKISDKIEGTILYTHPITKQIAITLKTKPEIREINNLLQNNKIGTIIENAIMMGRDDVGNTIFKLPNGMKGIATKKHLFDIEMNEFDLETMFAIGSSHKCRIISINLMDSMVGITLRQSLLDISSVSVDDLDVGSIIRATVKKVIKSGVIVQIGFGLKGLIPDIHLVEAPQVTQKEQSFPKGKALKCRVAKIDKSCTPCKVKLTAKKSLLSKNLNLLASYEAAKPGIQTCGVIALINKSGLLVEFFNDVKGFIPNRYLSTYKIEYPEKVFKVGQLVSCSVVETFAEIERMTCSLIDLKDKKMKKSKNFDLKVGQLLNKMKITNKSENGFDLTDDSTHITAFLPFGHLSDDTHLSTILSDSLIVGNVIPEVMVFKVKASLVIVTKKLTFINASKVNKLISRYEQLETNLIIPVVINGFADYGIFVENPGDVKGLVPKRYLIDEPKKLGFVLRQTVFAKIIQFEDKSGEEAKKKRNIAFSLKLSDVWDHGFEDRVNLFNNFMNDFQLAKKLIKKNKCDVINKICKFEIGQIVTYRVIDINDSQIICDVKADKDNKINSVKGIALKHDSDLETDIKLGTNGIAVVVNIDFDEQYIEIMIRQKLVKQIKNSLKINAISTVKEGQVIKCTSFYICDKYVLVLLGGHAPGQIAFIPSKRHLNDTNGISALFSIDNNYHIIVKSVSGDKVIGVLKSEIDKYKQKTIIKMGEKILEKLTKKVSKRELNEIEKKKEENHSEKENEEKDSHIGIDETHVKVNDSKSQIKSTKKRKLDQTNTMATEIIKDNVNKSKQDLEAITNESNVLKVNESFCWDESEARPNLNSITSLTAKEYSSESDSSESDSDNKTPKRKQTRRERNEEVRHREEVLRKREEVMMDTERRPETVDDYEISALASPNSSLVWLKYMAFHLEQAEIAKARAVGERALKTISFREEQEKLNIWVALLNLENLYGTQTSLDQLFERALQYNDHFVIYNHLANIYFQTNKLEESEALYHTMLKKFKQNKDVWINFGMFYMKNSRLESARKLMQRSLTCLEKRDHIDVISKFGQMEFKLGDVEHGKTLFENVLSNFPKRVDLWSVYIDMMIKYALKHDDKDTENIIRNIFERVITFKLAAKRMKFIFKRYIDFETQLNNEDRIGRIKEKALEYVEGSTLS